MTQPVSNPGNRAPSQPGLLPAALRGQVDEANRLIAELNARPAEPIQGQPPAASGQQWQPAPPAQPRSQSQPPAQAPDPPVTAVEPTPLEERLRQAEARYNSLQGKYNSERAADRAVIEQQSALVSQLLERDQRPAPAPPKDLTPEEYMRSLGATDQDIKDYGELLPIVMKLAQNMVRPTLAKLEGEIAATRRAAGTVANEFVKVKQNDVFAALDRAVPNWRQVNESEDFLDWLGVVDIFSGVTRRVALTSAFNTQDAARVAGIFEAYVGEHPDRARAAGEPQLDPATLLTPAPRGGSAGTPEGANAGGGRTWTEPEIANFYTRVRKKQVTPEEYKRISSEIHAAVAAGRVRPDRVDIHTNSH